jgi:hypothetical protein
MIGNHQEFLVSLKQVKELELALASVKREASSHVAFRMQAESKYLYGIIFMYSVASHDGYLAATGHPEEKL